MRMTTARPVAVAPAEPESSSFELDCAKMVRRHQDAGTILARARPKTQEGAAKLVVVGRFTTFAPRLNVSRCAW